MKYLLYDLGQAKEGNQIEVVLGYAVNVRIMNEENYDSFSQNGTHRFMGGYIERSPYKVPIPFDDHWYTVIEAGSFFGKIKSLVKLKTDPSEENASVVITPTTCELSPRKSLAKVTNFSDAVVKRKLKAFVLHYFKDTSNVAAPLAEAFEKRGLPINYSDYMLEPGDDAMQAIKTGLSKHKFGIIIISRSMVNAGWKQADIDYIKDLIQVEKLLIPVWQNITKGLLSHHWPAFEELLINEPEKKDSHQIADEIIDILMN